LCSGEHVLAGQHRAIADPRESRKLGACEKDRSLLLEVGQVVPADRKLTISARWKLTRDGGRKKSSAAVDSSAEVTFNALKKSGAQAGDTVVIVKQETPGIAGVDGPV